MRRNLKKLSFITPAMTGLRKQLPHLMEDEDKGWISSKHALATQEVRRTRQRAVQSEAREDYLYYVSQEYCTQLKLVGCGHHWRGRFIHHKPAQACIHKANVLRQEGFTHMHRGVAVLEHQYIAAREVMGRGVCRAGDNRTVDGQANVLCPIQDSICVIKGRPGGAWIFLERVAPNASTQHIPPRQIIIEEFTLRQPVLELQDALVAGNRNELRLVVSAGEKDKSKRPRTERPLTCMH
ncbi:hypothetical protein V8E55_008538 [Tylopilus felleus]